MCGHMGFYFVCLNFFFFLLSLKKKISPKRLTDDVRRVCLCGCVDLLTGSWSVHLGICFTLVLEDFYIFEDVHFGDANVLYLLNKLLRDTLSISSVVVTAKRHLRSTINDFTILMNPQSAFGVL